eukprot:8563871-Lingulodinium_polyedra.AAC.1
MGTSASAAPRGGPVAAALASLRRLGLGDDLEAWQPGPWAPADWGEFLPNALETHTIDAEERP